ncbi:hypothetical protein [Nostoc sp.]|uniref:hypothetical protein n=1 Tax=Nostoc sp. TaxID=1180 RepID=UPI003FA5BDC2
MRQAVAQNPNTPISTLEKLARDEDGNVRMNVASKINLSPQTIHLPFLYTRVLDKELSKVCNIIPRILSTELT